MVAGINPAPRRTGPTWRLFLTRKPVFDGDTNGEIHETYWGGGNSLTTYQLADPGSSIASISFAVTSS